MTRKISINKFSLNRENCLLLAIIIGLAVTFIYGNNIDNAVAADHQYVGRHAGFNVSVDGAIRDALKHVPYTKKPYPQYKLIEIRVSKGSTVPKHTIVVLELAKNKI